MNKSSHTKKNVINLFSKKFSIRMCTQKWKSICAVDQCNHRNLDLHCSYTFIQYPLYHVSRMLQSANTAGLYTLKTFLSCKVSPMLIFFHPVFWFFFAQFICFWLFKHIVLTYVGDHVIHLFMLQKKIIKKTHGIFLKKKFEMSSHRTWVSKSWTYRINTYAQTPTNHKVSQKVCIPQFSEDACLVLH